MNESPSTPGSPWFASSSHHVLLVASESVPGGALFAAASCVDRQIHVRPSWLTTSRTMLSSSTVR